MPVKNVSVMDSPASLKHTKGKSPEYAHSSLLLIKQILCATVCVHYVFGLHNDDYQNSLSPHFIHNAM